ncbi:MAG: pyridoxamine 5'-phosphate oxidase family protein [Deltaproteobacteria bacterium]|nr:pyridoxamine 5'-phosphate oxidase family protein [Deltaproteobacteria bacterium]
MNFQDCIKFAKENPVCYVATADGDQPRIRPLGLWFADEKGFYFQTESVKAIYRQLKSNPRIELCFFAAAPPPGKVLRVAGKIEFLDDLALKSKVLTDRPFLKGLGINEPGDPLLVLFHVGCGEAYFWTMADNMKESQIERIKFGA